MSDDARRRANEHAQIQGSFTRALVTAASAAERWRDDGELLVDDVRRAVEELQGIAALGARLQAERAAAQASPALRLVRGGR